MRRTLVILALVGLMPTVARGQEWTSEQMEVWQTVESYWQMFADGNAEGFLTYLHDDFSGWTHTNAMPRDKSDMARYLPRGFEKTRTVLHDVTPVGIKVHGAVAVVHYYYTRTYEDLSGGENSDAGRWTDILMKQGDRWMMIADHGGSDSGR